MSKYYIHCKTQDEWNDILKIYATLISKHKEKDKGFKENDYSRHCESTIFEIDLKNPEYCYYGHKNTYLRDPIYKQKDIIALEQFYQLHPEYQKKQNKKEMKEQILKILEKTYSNESLRKKQYLCLCRIQVSARPLLFKNLLKNLLQVKVLKWYQ